MKAIRAILRLLLNPKSFWFINIENNKLPYSCSRKSDKFIFFCIITIFFRKAMLNWTFWLQFSHLISAKEMLGQQIDWNLNYNIFREKFYFKWFHLNNHVFNFHSLSSKFLQKFYCKWFHLNNHVFNFHSLSSKFLRRHVKKFYIT